MLLSITFLGHKVLWIPGVSAKGFLSATSVVLMFSLYDYAFLGFFWGEVWVFLGFFFESRGKHSITLVYIVNLSQSKLGSKPRGHPL